MCGIVGAIGFINQDYFDKVQQINNSMTHRGPDASGIWSSGLSDRTGVIFAHRRLSIIDLNPESNQPFLDHDSRTVITYNGEVYNFRELRKELQSSGFRFRTKSDTEVVLKSYLHWGSNCVEKFRGMFSFAIYDPRKHQVFIARDRLGIKPLYYMNIKKTNELTTLVFASEIRALLSSNLIERKMDKTGFSSYLWNGFVSGPNTIVRGIQRLDPGTSMIVKINGLNVEYKRYWQLPDAKIDRDAEEKLTESLIDSVKMRMVSDVPLGVFLSGGIDSSAITALAAKSSNTPIKTFNIAFEESKYDESIFAKKVAEKLGTDHTEVYLSEELFKTELPNAIGSLDQPTFDGLNTYFVSRAVKEAGITVAIAGTGGDELFGGYSNFRELPGLRRASQLAQILPDKLIKSGSSFVSRMMYGKPVYIPHQTRWGKLGEALCQGGDLFKLYQLSSAIFLPDFINDLSGGICPSGCISGIPDLRVDEIKKNINGNPVLHAISQLELSSFIGDRLLIDTDMTSMASSLEVRVPLLDHVVIERIAAVDAKKRFYPIQKKQLLRNSALNELDPSFFNRSKAGFELPIGRWCRQTLKEEISEAFSDKDACNSIGLNSAVISNLWKAYQNKTPGLYWSRIWSIFVLLWWTKKYRVSL